MTRLLDLPSSVLTTLDRRDLVDSVRESEGRVMAAETIGAYQPLLEDVTNAELVAGFGADLLICNLFDVDTPSIAGLPECAPDDVIRTLKELTGRVVGINLEPFGVPAGRLATAANASRAVALGVQFIVVTANPKTGVDNASIAASVREVSDAVGDAAMVVGGRMHGSGMLAESGSRIVGVEDVRGFVEAGADMVLLPAPGTVPGITAEHIHHLIDTAHDLGALALTAIGTSQEGADPATIRAIALACKQAGADVHHLGDGGYSGISAPENVFHYSVAIRGVRHTYRRMGWSIRR
ncbi:DUF7916 family protein [Nigerium massiliense]|uniref:DUF7916 family protein n=1 Tax=Nigerium massiliense TaxID=1522317 RepID=UPI00058B5FF2|nr:hypothetical protein [Nigerium massiliense]